MPAGWRSGQSRGGYTPVFDEELGMAQVITSTQTKTLWQDGNYRWLWLVSPAPLLATFFL